jgi:hypothetical protein
MVWDVSFGSLDKPQLMKMTHINKLTLIKFHNEAIAMVIAVCADSLRGNLSVCQHTTASV